MTSATPLEGITIVELGHSVAAPFAGAIFGQLGATVIKVEKPGKGDHTRGWGPPFTNGTAAIFEALNRDKRGVAVDMQDPEEAAILRAFILQQADVVIQNLRPGAAEKLGFGAAALTAAKPGLIYCSLSAFGAVGPMRDNPGYDPLMQAYGGIMSVTGEAGRSPVRVGVSLIDMTTGMWSTIAILAALFERRSSGLGGQVSTSLFESAIAMMGMHIAAHMMDGKTPGRHGSGAGFVVPYQTFETKDGHLMVAAGNDGLFRKLCSAIELPEMADDPRFATNSDRVTNREQLLPVLVDIFSSGSVASWRERLDAAGVPNSPLLDVGQVVKDEQTKSLGILQSNGQVDAAIELVGLPMMFDGVRPPFDLPPPRLGEHQGILIGKTES